jgi:hypothetical protein
MIANPRFYQNHMNFNNPRQNIINNQSEDKGTQTENKTNTDLNKNPKNDIIRYNDNQIYEM